MNEYISVLACRELNLEDEDANPCLPQVQKTKDTETRIAIVR